MREHRLKVGHEATPGCATLTLRTGGVVNWMQETH